MKMIIPVLLIFPLYFEAVAEDSDKVEANFSEDAAYTEDLYKANKSELEGLAALRRKENFRSKLKALTQCLDMNLDISEDDNRVDLEEMLMRIKSTGEEKIDRIQEARDSMGEKKTSKDEKLQMLLNMYWLVDDVLVHSIEMGNVINSLKHFEIPCEKLNGEMSLLASLIEFLDKSTLKTRIKERRKKGIKRLRELSVNLDYFEK